jgi:hypothetical protein
VNGSLERKDAPTPASTIQPVERAKELYNDIIWCNNCQIATIVAGERPTDLTRDEAVAYDVAAALNRSGPLPETIYEAGIDAFGTQGMAEIIYLVGCFHLVGVILNGYDVSVPGREDGKQP